MNNLNRADYIAEMTKGENRTKKFAVIINTVEYEVLLVDADSEKLLMDEVAKCGTIHHDDAKIYIADYLKGDVLKRVLIHELTHAFLFECGMATIDNFTIEHVCEIMSCFAKKVTESAEEIMEILKN